MVKPSGIMRVIALVVFVLTCSACQPLVLPSARDQAMRQVFNEVRDGQLKNIQPALAPRLQNPTSMATLAKIGTLIPKTTPTRVRVAQWNIQHAFMADRYGAIYQYDYPDKVLIVRSQMAQPQQGGPAVIETFWVNSFTKTQAAAIDRFTLTGKSPLEYAVLIAAILSPLTILVALIDLIRAKGVKRKWLWALGMIWGVCGVGLNWSNGMFAILFLNILLFGAGIGKAAA